MVYVGNVIGPSLNGATPSKGYYWKDWWVHNQPSCGTHGFFPEKLRGFRARKSLVFPPETSGGFQARKLGVLMGFSLLAWLMLV